MPSRSELIRLLTEYRPTDPDEQGYRLEMLDLAAASLDPFDRHHYAPGHFTASGFALNPQGDRVLLIQHAKLDLWLQPGGHIDPDDATAIDAAQREITEETGIGGLRTVSTSLLDLDIHVFPGTSDQPEHRHFDLRFAFVAVDEQHSPNDEVHEVRWVDSADLVGLGVDRSVLRPAGKVLGDGIMSGQ